MALTTKILIGILNKHMHKVKLLVLICLLALTNLAIAEGKIVKWVDKNGVTQYGDKLPASEAGRNNAEMNTQGRVLKKNVAADKSNEAIDLQKIEQDRKDKILLASYTNAEEIDLARERNLQMDKAAMQALTQQKLNVVARNTRNNKSADGFKARKKPVPAYLLDELKLAKVEIMNIDKQLAQRKLSMEATGERYTAESARFIALKQPAALANTPNTNTPVAGSNVAGSNDTGSNKSGTNTATLGAKPINAANMTSVENKAGLAKTKPAK